MANEFNNDTLVSKEDLENINRLQKGLTDAANSMEGLLQKTQKLSSDLSKSSSSVRDMVNVMKQLDDVDKKASETIEEYRKKLSELEKEKDRIINKTQQESKELHNLTKEYNQSNAAIEQQSKTLKDISVEAYNRARSEIVKLDKELVGLNKTYLQQQERLKQLRSDYKNGIINQDQFIQSTSNLKRDMDDQKKTIDDYSNRIKYNNTIIYSTIGSYNNLSAQYSRLKLDINQLSEAETLNGYTKKELEAQAKTLYEEMSRLQKATGKSQLDVGQYDKAVGDLTTTLRIIDPTLGMLIGRIQNVSVVKRTWITWNDKLVKGLNLSAKAANVLQIATVALVVGGIYLAIKAFQEWNAEQERIQAVSLETINKINESAASIAGSQRATFERLRQEYENINGVIAEQEKFIRDNQEAFHGLGVEIKNVNDADNIFIQNADAFILSINKRALGAAAMNLAAEKYQESIQKMLEAETKIANPTSWDKFRATILEFIGFGDRMENLNEIISDEADTLNTESQRALKGAMDIIRASIEIGSEADELLKSLGIKLYSKGAEKSAQEAQKFAEIEKKAYQDVIQFDLQQDITAQKFILENNKKSYEARLEALDTYDKKSRELIISSMKFQLKQENLTSSQKDFIRKNAQAQLLKLRNEGNKLEEQITKDYVESQIEEYNKLLDLRNRDLSKGENIELFNLSADYTQGVINQEEYEQKKLDVTKKYALLRMEAEINSLNSILEITDISEEEKLKITEKIEDARLKYIQYVNNEEIKLNDKRRSEELKKEEKFARERQKLYQSLVKEISNLFETLYEGNAEKNLAELDKQSEDNQEWRDRELERIEENETAGVLTKEQAEAQKQAIESQSRQREEELEQQRKKILERQARWEKAKALAQVIIDTASGIVKAVALSPLTGGMPFAAIVAAIGAAQAAAIAARPIPQYKDGTMDHKGGLAIVGDGGRSEMILTPSGGIFKSPDIPTLVNLPAHSQVKPDYEKALIESALKREKLQQLPDKNIVVLQENKKVVSSMNDLKKLTKENNLLQQKSLQFNIYSNNMSYRNPSLN